MGHTTRSHGSTHAIGETEKSNSSCVRVRKLADRNPSIRARSRSFYSKVSLSSSSVSRFLTAMTPETAVTS
jgi:hypothetical protein